jgi:hypothetical protein
MWDPTLNGVPGLKIETWGTRNSVVGLPVEQLQVDAFAHGFVAGIAGMQVVA